MKRQTIKLKSAIKNIYLTVTSVFMVIGLVCAAFTYAKKPNTVNKKETTFKSYKDSLCEVCVQRNLEKLGEKNANKFCKGIVFQLDSLN